MSRYDYDLIVIGTGAGGSVAAHIAAAAGRKVAIVEAGEFGGECPNWGDVPTKAMLHAAKIYDDAKQASRFGIRTATIGYNYPTIRAWKDLAVKRTGTARGKAAFESEGINVIRGEADFISANEITVGRRHYSAAQFLIATGAVDAAPSIEGLDKVSYITSHQATTLTRPPKSLFIIGGGAVGCEFAQLFSVFGSKITIADLAPRLLAREDQELGVLLKEHLQARGVNVLTSTKIVKVEKDGIMKRVHFQQGAEILSVKVDEIMLATGKVPALDIGLENAGVEYTAQGITVDEYMQTSARNIFAAGDVVGKYMFTHTAIYQSRVAAHNLLHRQKVAADYKAIPRVIFTDPEIAAVGITEDEAIKYAIKYRTAMSPLSIVGRANVNDIHEGFVKVISDREGKLIGASIAAPHAGEMIHELALAVQMDLLASDIASTVHAFPTWSEAIRIACSKLAH